MTKAKVADTFWVAPKLTNQQYNSANQYYRTPLAHSDNIDHIYTGPGVGVRAWSQVLELSGGKFVGAIPSDHNPAGQRPDVPVLTPSSASRSDPWAAGTRMATHSTWWVIGNRSNARSVSSR